MFSTSVQTPMGSSICVGRQGDDGHTPMGSSMSLQCRSHVVWTSLPPPLARIGVRGRGGDVGAVADVEQMKHIGYQIVGDWSG